MIERKIELITIGDEILLGHTLDTNAQWIARRLTENGFRLRWHDTVRDNESDMRHILKRAWNRADAVLVTGGLGPTHDDITCGIIARFFDDELIERIDLRERIVERFAARGVEPPAGFEVMAQFPTRATPMLNKRGSAPGIHYHQDGRDLFAMPGVPVEMKEMFANYVIPQLERRRSGVYRFRLFKTTGTGESRLAELIGDPATLEPVTLAFLPSIDQGVTVRLSCGGRNVNRVMEQLGGAVDFVRGRIGEYIYAVGEQGIEEIILDIMRRRNLKLAVAESCTGGMICNRLVAVPGSSDVFDRGFITYSNRAKMEQLDVDGSILEKYGAVSEQTAMAMAEGARLRAGADVTISVTGIAGPTGGTVDKPVGLVYVGLSDSAGTIVGKFRFSGDRDANRRRSAGAALTMLWRRLKQ